MAEKRTRSAFHEALASASSARARGPLHSTLIASDAGIVIDKASDLLGYHDYVGRARAWKRARGSAPTAFEREVQAQAMTAFGDTHALAAATVRMTSQFERSGALDGLLGQWVTAVGSARQLSLADLHRDLDQESVREIVRREGVPDAVWTSVVENLKQIDGRLSVRKGRLAFEIAMPDGSGRKQSIEFAESATGMPGSVTDLLRCGRFERLAKQFERDGAHKLHLLPRDDRPFELSELVLGGAILGVQGAAQHRRGLEDAGLATYAGSAGVVIWIVAALAVLAIGYLLVDKYCEGDDANKAACIVGKILAFLGMLALSFGIFIVLGLLLGFDEEGGGEVGCPGPGRVIVIDLLTGEVGCGPKSTGG